MGYSPRFTVAIDSLLKPMFRYGCADTVTGLAFGQVHDILNFLKSNSDV